MTPNTKPVLSDGRKNPETKDPRPGEKDDYHPEDFPSGDEADKEGGNAGPEEQREP